VNDRILYALIVLLLLILIMAATTHTAFGWF
jgi:uncharacterized integral membrane protein